MTRRATGSLPATYTSLFTRTKAEMEAERLHLMAEVFDEHSRTMLESVGLEEGMRCLDVGAGAGTMAHWIAGRTGAGEVVALDREVGPLLGSRGRECNITVVEADLTAQGIGTLLEAGSFDLIHTRSLLGVLADPEAALRRLLTWLAPGGTLVVSDLWASPLDGTMGQALRGAMRAGVDLMTATVGVDPAWATRLPNTLSDHGLQEVGMHVAAPVLTADSGHARFLRVSLSLLGEPLIVTGLLTSRQLSTALTDLQDSTLTAVPLIMVSAWGRKS
jgi:ubiquinone/menaquinone biosynthesis C-methylase UbiE